MTSGTENDPETAGDTASKSSAAAFPKNSAPTKFVVVLIVGLIVFFLYKNFGDALSLDKLASRETELRQYQADNPYLVYGLAFVVYVAVTGLSLPGAAVLTLVFGWYFGFARALLLVSFASTAGATVAFLLSRFLLRNTIQNRFGSRLATFNESLEKEGAFYLFTLRLIPAVPFFVINVVMGLTPIRTWTFWWVSQIGMLAGTAVYVYAGAQFPDLKTLAEKGGGGILTPQLIIAFVILGIFPLAVRKIMSRFRPTDPADLQAM